MRLRQGIPDTDPDDANLHKQPDAVGDEAGRPPSRSQRKRESHAVQDAARRLLALSPAELATLSLSPATLAAVAETARIKDRRAMPRHVKRVANLLEREDLEAIDALLASRQAMDQAAAARHHRIERWRDRLLAEGDPALRELLDICPGADRQALRQMVRAAQRDREAGRPEGPRKLFRTLRAALDSGIPAGMTGRAATIEHGDCPEAASRALSSCSAARTTAGHRKAG